MKSPSHLRALLLYSKIPPPANCSSTVAGFPTHSKDATGSRHPTTSETSEDVPTTGISLSAIADIEENRGGVSVQTLQTQYLSMNFNIKIFRKQPQLNILNDSYNEIGINLG